MMRDPISRRLARCGRHARQAMLYAAVALLGCIAPPAGAQPFSFGLWGDLPYAKANDAAKMPALIADMNASDIAFSLHIGDIRSE